MSLNLRSSLLGSMVALALVFSLSACSDDPNPRSPGGDGGASIGSGGSPDEDVGIDVAEDVDEDVEDPAELCELLPTDANADFRIPCCFEDEDCHTSDAPNAEMMVCYNASCEEGGEGTCRVPPSGEGLCWADSDCPEGQRCPYGDLHEQYRCTHPNIQELPRTCVDE